MTEEIVLGGGYVNDVVRVGDTVRRRLRAPLPFAQELLRFLEERDWPGAPRFLGFDPEGRQVLSWIEGHVPWVGVDGPPSVWGERAVAGVAELTRQFHDLTTGSRLAGDSEVVCHNDLSPKNTVYQPLPRGSAELRPVAFIDWDIAAPGQRIHDVAHLCWQWAVGATSPLDAATRLIRVAADAYGCSPSDRAELVETILWWQDRCWRGIQAKIDAGDPSVRRLKETGAVEAVRADWEWTRRHRPALEQALLDGGPDS